VIQGRLSRPFGRARGLLWLGLAAAGLLMTVPGCADDETGPGDLPASGDGDPAGDGDAVGSPSSRVLFTFDCDLLGVTGELTMEVEAVGASGVVWGSGPSPDITGVIGTGDVIYYTAGELRSPNAHYIFTGENQFADFTETTTLERFRVQWSVHADGVDMIVNPFGPGPAVHRCLTTSARYL